MPTKRCHNIWIIKGVCKLGGHFLWGVCDGVGFEKMLCGCGVGVISYVQAGAIARETQSRDRVGAIARAHTYARSSAKN